jgi:hypothetical protein
MSSASLVERARIGARADFHEKAARLVVGPACIGEAKELTTLERGSDGLRTPR